MSKRFIGLMLLGLIGFAAAGCNGSQVSGKLPQPEEEGPPMPKMEFSIKAEEGGAIELKPADGSRVKIVFPQGSLNHDSDLEVQERPDRGQDVTSYGFSLANKGSEEGPELKYPALLMFYVDKDLGQDVSIVRYTRDGFEVVPTRVSLKDGKTALMAQVVHFSSYGTRRVTSQAIQAAKNSQDASAFNWVIYVKDSADVDAGSMKRKVNLEFKAVNTSGDIAGQYKGYAHAKTTNDLEALGGKIDADFQIKDENVSFDIEPYVELGSLVERDDGLANLEPEKWPDYMGQGTLNMGGSGTGTISAGGRSYSRGIDATQSRDSMTVAITGPLVRLSVTVNGVGTMYFDGYIRGEGK